MHPIQTPKSLTLRALLFSAAGLAGIGLATAGAWAHEHGQVPHQEMTPEAHPMEHDMDHDHGSHGKPHHSPSVQVPMGVPIPAVDLQVSADRHQGWNVALTVENFQFAPERLDQTHQYDEGHAHLYLNGEKIARLYGPWFHIASLPPGEHELMVTLNSNQHGDILVDNTPVSATVMVSVPE